MNNTSSFLMIAADKESFDFIQRLEGKCLLYDKAPHENLAFCYQRDVWILYALAQHFAYAMQLARRVQRAGSSKVLVMLIQR